MPAHLDFEASGSCWGLQWISFGLSSTPWQRWSARTSARLGQGMWNPLLSAPGKPPVIVRQPGNVSIRFPLKRKAESVSWSKSTNDLMTTDLFRTTAADVGLRMSVHSGWLTWHVIWARIKRWYEGTEIGPLSLSRMCDFQWGGI